MKSVEELLNESDRLLGELVVADVELAGALSDDSEARRQLKSAEQELSLAEAEVITTAVTQANMKEGPLAGIAKTSDAYKMAVAKLLADAHQGDLNRVYLRTKQRQIQADDRKVALEQATVRFSAIRHASNLLASMLQATISISQGATHDNVVSNAQ
ncbi:MAG: hypothetical protein R2867_19790 [Caldilineaceae bacterium]